MTPKEPMKEVTAEIQAELAGKTLPTQDVLTALYQEQYPNNRKPLVPILSKAELKQKGFGGLGNYAGYFVVQQGGDTFYFNPIKTVEGKEYFGLEGVGGELMAAEKFRKYL